MSFLRPVFAVLATSALYLSMPACSMGTESVAAAESNLGSVSPSSVVGELAVGTTSAPVAYTSAPTYRAFSFDATAGDLIDVWVRSTDGDAVAWVTDADFKSLSSNDDAFGGTRDAHVEAAIEKTGRHYVVFRERDLEPATFTVSLGNGDLPGTRCTTQDEITDRPCGMCGTKKSVCARDAQGNLVWSAFSVCQGEHGECVAGTTESQACGNCGTRSVTCSAQCKWTSGACSVPATNGCSPGSFDITNAGCPQPFTYRVRECSATCGYGSFGACGAAPTRIEVGPTPGSASSTVVVLDGALARLSTNTCPATSLSPVSTAYAYTQVHNPHDKPITVVLFHSLAPSDTAFDTALAVYPTATAPTTVDERKACLKASNIGTAALTADTRFASLDSVTKKVTIPAGETYLVYSTAENAATATQSVRLTVKTDRIEP